MFHALKSDVGYACRLLLRSPGFTAIAVLSLAVGIGFNTALFSIVDALLLRPMPVERPDRLVDVYTRGSDGGRYATSSYPDFLDFRSRNEVFQDMLGYSPAIAAVKFGERSRMALGEVVTGNYFQVLGVGTTLGRTLLPEDDRPGAQRAVVLSHQAWVRDFGANPGVLNKRLTIHGQPYTIVGVAPEAFTGMVPMLQPEMWLPIAWVEEVEPAGIQDVVTSPTGQTRVERRGQRWMFIKGRLKDGETVARADANLQLIMTQLAAEHPQTNTDRPIAVATGVRVHPDADRAVRPVAIGLMLGIGLVLLIACANVANMLLARASARQKEIGIRLAIGATRGRLVRQLLTESLVLAACGALAGVAVAAVLLPLIHALPLPIPVPLGLNMRIDGRVLLYTSLVATLAGLIAGLAPAVRATRPDLASSMKGEGSSQRTAGRRWSLRDGLVAGQTAVTLVLLVSAALLTRSLIEAQRIDLGFRAEGLVAVSAEFSLLGYDANRATAIMDRVIERVREMPGVVSASRTVRQPLAINYHRNSIFFPDRHAPGQPGVPVAVTWVDDRYFATLGVPLLRGRNVSAADLPASPRVTVVNEAFARTFWPGSDALGSRFKLRGADGPEYEVVGVVADYKVETVGEPPTPYIHYPLAQRPSTGAVLLARSSLDPDALLVDIRREILALEPNAVLFENQTMEQLVDVSLVVPRLAAQALALVGLVATALAAIGLYGVVAYTVARRRREIGIRMSLGASPRMVLSMIMRQGLAVASAGLLVGAVFSWIAGRALSAGLYGVSAIDPAAWTAAIGVLLGAAALANYLPARRAARVDPSVALRPD